VLGVVLALAGAASWNAAEGAEAVEGEAFFEQKIRPILVNRCYECHSAEAKKLKGGLRVDTREDLLQGGDTGAALAPGDPDNSRIVIAVRHTDPDLRMPPKEKIPDAEIEAITQWVKMGAPHPKSEVGKSSASGYAPAKALWSAQPIREQPVPAVKNAGWVRDPIDAFILAGLEKAGLEPAPAAGRGALLRRASFDLLGLPPERAASQKFLDNSSEGAEGAEVSFSEAVDGMLESPHFGERWGRHWLDVARYADSNGLDQNAPLQNAWRYRDWVVQAFNEDKPLNDFIREQIAGDLLPYKDEADRRRKWIATGFLVIGPKNFAEPNREKLLMDVADEQIDVTSKAFLGLTVSCARCHDHKFDPIPTRDYYAMAGIFRSTETLAANRGGRQNASPFSERLLGSEAEIAAWEKHEAALAAAEAQRDRARRMARELPGGIDSKELDGIVLDNLEAEVDGGWALSNYSTNFVDKNYLHDGNERVGKGKKAVRFRPKIPREGLYEIRLAYTARPNRATNVPVRVTSGAMARTISLNQQNPPPHDHAFESLGFFNLAAGTNSVVEVGTAGTKGFVVVDAVQFLPQDVELAGKLMKRRAVPEAEMDMAMAGATAARLEELEYKVMELMASTPAELPEGLPRALAVKEGQPRPVKIHIRGDPERLGEEVPRGFLTVLRPEGAELPAADASGRRELADWIANGRNPLTARVMANRIWHHLFGRGLVPTTDNFGAMGEAPSHPELLDYLAGELIANGWSAKKLIRRILLTRTYQMGSQENEKARAADPENRLLWRMNPKRLEAEALRDAMLAANGTLDRAVGGPPQQAAMAAPAQPVPELPPPVFEDSSRRSLYLPVLRGNLQDLFQVFDFPDPHFVAGRRFTTTAPTQALFLMNSPFVLRQARAWAEKLAAESGRSDAELAAEVYAAAYGRTAAKDELARASAFLENYRAALAQAEPDAAARKIKAWQGFCQAILQSTEFRFLD